MKETVLCDCCRTIPVSYLSLDVAVPVAGWDQALAERGIEVAPDDLGRPSVPRHVLAELLAEASEHETRLAERPPPAHEPVAAGVPAGEGLSAFESLAASPGYVTARDELGRPRPNFLDRELSEGQRQAAEEREGG